MSQNVFVGMVRTGRFAQRQYATTCDTWQVINAVHYSSLNTGKGEVSKRLQLYIWATSAAA